MRYCLRTFVGLAALAGLLVACAGPKRQERGLRLFLLSRGLVTDTLKAALLEFVGADPSTMHVAVVANATRSVAKQEKKVRKVKERMASVGFDTTRIDRIDVRFDDPHRLEEFDLVYILGGNPFVLLADVRASGADTVLARMAISGKPIMGYSAGALLLGPDLALMQAVDPLLGFNGEKIADQKCLGLYDFRIFPHYAGFSAQVDGLAAVIDSFEAATGEPVFRLNDNQGYLVGERRLFGR